MRKILSMLLVFAMLLGLLAACGNTDIPDVTEATNPGESEVVEQGDIVILYTNDVHTYIDNPLSYDVIAAVKTELQKEYEYVLLLDAGDHIQGTAYGSMDKGATIVSLMNAAGYDAATLGNHEFDYGMDGTMNVIEWADYTYVSSNFYHEENGVVGENVLPAYKLFTFGGETVAILGITTTESFTKSTPAYFQDENGNYIYGIAGGENGVVDASNSPLVTKYSNMLMDYGTLDGSGRIVINAQ